MRTVGVLTGNMRYRLGFRGALVLQVEYSTESYKTPYSLPIVGCPVWKDATVIDMQQIRITGSLICKPSTGPGQPDDDKRF